MSLPAAAGLAAGAAVAVPLGVRVERRGKRPVTMGMDVLRCGALLSVPAAFALHRLTYVPLLVVTVVVNAASFGLSALGLRVMGEYEPPPATVHRRAVTLFFNTIMVRHGRGRNRRLLPSGESASRWQTSRRWGGSPHRV